MQAYDIERSEHTEHFTKLHPGQLRKGESVKKKKKIQGRHKCINI